METRLWHYMIVIPQGVQDGRNNLLVNCDWPGRNARDGKAGEDLQEISEWCLQGIGHRLTQTLSEEKRNQFQS